MRKKGLVGSWQFDRELNEQKGARNADHVISIKMVPKGCNSSINKFPYTFLFRWLFEGIFYDVFPEKLEKLLEGFFSFSSHSFCNRWDFQKADFIE